jgi:hypothetical protein
MVAHTYLTVLNNHATQTKTTMIVADAGKIGFLIHSGGV